VRKYSRPECQAEGISKKSIAKRSHCEHLETELEMLREEIVLQEAMRVSESISGD
jgi:hypothetical protein